MSMCFNSSYYMPVVSTDIIQLHPINTLCGICVQLQFETQFVDVQVGPKIGISHVVPMSMLSVWMRRHVWPIIHMRYFAVLAS